jgi:hypothetical protein
MEDSIPHTTREVETRYRCWSAVRLAAEAKMIGGLHYIRHVYSGEIASDIRNDARKHGEGVLKPKEQCEEDRHPIIEAKEWSCSTLFLHKRQVGLEKKGIVVCTDEAFSVWLLVAA